MSARKVLRTTVVAIALSGGFACEAPSGAANSPSEATGSVGIDTMIDGRHSFVPADGMVPDSATAAAVARVLLTRIYTRAVMREEEPLTARLEADVWIVVGTLPEGMLGGAARIELAKADGRVLRVTHGK